MQEPVWGWGRGTYRAMGVPGAVVIMAECQLASRYHRVRLERIDGALLTAFAYRHAAQPDGVKADEPTYCICWDYLETSGPLSSVRLQDADGWHDVPVEPAYERFLRADGSGLFGGDRPLPFTLGDPGLFGPLRAGASSPFPFAYGEVHVPMWMLVLMTTPVRDGMRKDGRAQALSVGDGWL